MSFPTKWQGDHKFALQFLTISLTLLRPCSRTWPTRTTLTLHTYCTKRSKLYTSLWLTVLNSSYGVIWSLYRHRVNTGLLLRRVQTISGDWCEPVGQTRKPCLAAASAGVSGDYYVRDRLIQYSSDRNLTKDRGRVLGVTPFIPSIRNDATIF